MGPCLHCFGMSNVGSDSPHSHLSWKGLLVPEPACVAQPEQEPAPCGPKPLVLEEMKVVDTNSGERLGWNSCQKTSLLIVFWLMSSGLLPPLASVQCFRRADAASQLTLHSNGRCFSSLLTHPAILAAGYCFPSYCVHLAAFLFLSLGFPSRVFCSVPAPLWKKQIQKSSHTSCEAVYILQLSLLLSHVMIVHQSFHFAFHFGKLVYAASESISCMWLVLSFSDNVSQLKRRMESWMKGRGLGEC